MLESRLQRLTAQGVNVVTMALDCDGLKRSTIPGHNAGDEAIILLARAISASIRSSDYGVRLGGDEFFLILIDYPHDEAENIAAKIRQYLAIHDHQQRVDFSLGRGTSRARTITQRRNESCRCAPVYEQKQKKPRPSQISFHCHRAGLSFAFSVEELSQHAIARDRRHTPAVMSPP